MLKPIVRFATSVVLGSLLLAASCENPLPLPNLVRDTRPPVFLTAPVLTPNPNASAPLAATIAVQTDEPAQILLGFREQDRSWEVLAGEDFQTVRSALLVLGVRPDRLHAIYVTAIDAAGNRSTHPQPLTFQTPPLPADFPPLHVTVSDPSRMERGLTLFNTNYSSPTVPGSGNFIVMLDPEGEVVWFYKGAAASNYEAVRHSSGNFFIIGSGLGAKTVMEIDLLGNTVHVWAATGTGVPPPPGSIPVPVDTFHHELREMPEGEEADFLALSTEMRVYADYPSSEVDPTQTTPTANVVGDVIVEFRRDGSIVRETRLLDILDPYRVVYGSLAGFYNAAYGGALTLDWSHGNAVTLDRADNAYIVSLRHQDAVVKIRRDTGELLWILGAHERWNAPWSARLLTPVGSRFEWPFHQHSPHIAPWAPATNITMFDNGNYRVIPPATAPPASQWYSRAVEFTIDASAMTVGQVWAYGGIYDTTTPPFFSGFIGDADALAETGNVLVTDGAKLVPGQNKTYSRVVEVRRSDPAQPVFEVIVNDPAAASPSPYNWNVYRAERVDGVYP